MSSEEKVTLPRVAKGPRPMMFEDEANDILLSMNVSLLNELIVTRQRLDAVERLLDKNGVLKQADVNAFSPDEAAADQRDALREEISNRVFYLLLQQAERAENAVPEGAPGDDI
ncbi:MAG: hypothetical protein GKS03_00310 [Alphaproteobacteria bacterium]|nr:hypothetical protein [Alphaproteobacteria bacterium]